MESGLLLNTFVSQKIESEHFYSWPQAKLFPRLLSLPPSQKEITHSPRTEFSQDFFFCTTEKGVRGVWGGGGVWIMELKKLKINLRGHGSQVSISSTIFATFIFLVCLFCHNLASNMINVWRLTNKIFTKSIVWGLIAWNIQPWPTLFFTYFNHYMSKLIFILTIFLILKISLLFFTKQINFYGTNYGFSSKAS